MLEKAEIMPEEKKEFDEFMGEIKGDEQALDPFNEAPEKEVLEQKEEKTQEEVVEPVKNRRHRRLETQLETEKRANIELAARLAERTEMDKFRSETSGSLDEELSRIYGTETPETKRASEILQRAFDRFTTKAEERALARYQELQEATVKEQREAESEIDSNLEYLEDEFDVDLTSNTPQARKQRNDLLTLVERLSPKDNEGNVKEYADFTTAFEILQQQNKPDTSRQKDLASRGMVKSGASMPSKLEENAAERFLKESGII